MSIEEYAKNKRAFRILKSNFYVDYGLRFAFVQAL